MLNSKQLLGGLLIIGVSIAFIQCKKTPAPDNNGNNGGTGGTTTTYTYAADILPILTANCSCHLAGGSALGKADLTSYDKVVSEKSNLISSLSPGGKMAKPVYKYNLDNSNKIINWLNGGAPQN